MKLYELKQKERALSDELISIKALISSEEARIFKKKNGYGIGDIVLVSSQYDKKKFKAKMNSIGKYYSSATLIKKNGELSKINKHIWKDDKITLLPDFKLVEKGDRS